MKEPNISNSKPQVVLKPGKDKPIRNRHHWIFSGAIEKLPSFTDGDILQVVSHDGELLGFGYFNRQAKIIGRMLTFNQGDASSVRQELITHLNLAKKLRDRLFQTDETTAYRLINGEGDFLPGLIIDRYVNVFVMQISTLGMDKLKSSIVDWLKEVYQPIAIYEKSLLPSRKEEGLTDFQGALDGVVPAAEIVISENGLKFGVSVLHGQKTGFFLDHREMRKQIKALSKGKRVLNCFAYTGGFSIYAAAGGAKVVDSVDISASAMASLARNLVLNGFKEEDHRCITDDVFQFLRNEPLNYDIVILDPPAFAKRQKDIVQACRGYKDINRIAMQKMPAGSILLTSSCSYHVNEELFQTVVFQAAVEAGRSVRIIGRHEMAPDHPINICHPESDYLKSLLLYLD